MTSTNSAARPARASRWLVSAAVAAALGSSAVTPLAFAAEEELAEVTVTGSRIQRPRDLDAPSPIVTVEAEAFKNTSGTGIETVLNKMPQFVPGGTQFTSSIQSGAASSPGAATVNLRGLGPNRNLVLIDGRRAQPANASLVIDINTIPSAAIENVEVITGGASAVYGPDAIAGVVNFQLKHDFQGLDINMQTGISQEGDGSDSRVSVLMGMNSADDRGNIMVGIDWTKRDGVLQKNRDFYVNGWMDPGNLGGGFIVPRGYNTGQTANNRPTQAAVDALFPTVAPGTVSNSQVIYFNNDGTPFTADHGGLGYKGPLNSLDAGAFTMIRKLTGSGNLDQIFTDGFLSSPLERHSIFGKATYDITDNVSAYVQTNFSNVVVRQRGGLPPAITVWQAPIPVNAATPLPAALQSLLNSRAVVTTGTPPPAAGTTGPTSPWSLFQVLDYNGAINTTNTNNVWQILAGLKGNVGFRDWTWDAYVSRGDTNIIAETSHLPSLQRYQFLVAKPGFGAGTNFTSSGSGYRIDCPSGLPVFSEFSPSASCLKGIETRMRNETDLTQEIMEANLQGMAFTLPTGDVRFAAGVSYRKNDFVFDPGNSVEQVLDNPVGLFASNGTNGSTNVKEIYGEALVPVIKNLDLELGYRFSDFNTAGGHSTYKALFTWKAMNELSFRGGYQFATRAPNTAELFTGPTQAVVAFPNLDPCSVNTLSAWGNKASNPNRLKVQALCRALIGNSTSLFDTGPGGPNAWFRPGGPAFFPLEIEITKGNPNVGPETGKTYTLGAVISNPFGWDRLNITVDAYKIDLTDTISPISSTIVYNNCFNSDGASNPTYDVTNSWCKLIARHPVTGDRATVDALYSNLGNLTTQGLDVGIAWSVPVGPGNLGLNTNFTYLDKFEYQTSPTSALVDSKGTADQIGQLGGMFTFRAYSTASYRWNSFDLNLGWQYYSSLKNQAAALNPATTVQGTPSYNLFNLSGGYRWDKYTFRAGIDNLLDKKPLVYGANPGVDTNTDTTLPQFYDPLGRRFYVGVEAKF
ncbi:MAG: TonB-dependent receptor [Pseudomonadota bacterium]